MLEEKLIWYVTIRDWLVLYPMSIASYVMPGSRHHQLGAYNCSGSTYLYVHVRMTCSTPSVWWSHTCSTIGSCAECYFGWRCGSGLCGWHGHSALGSFTCWLCSRISISIGIQISVGMVILCLQLLVVVSVSIFKHQQYKIYWILPTHVAFDGTHISPRHLWRAQLTWNARCLVRCCFCYCCWTCWRTRRKWKGCLWNRVRAVIVMLQ